MFSKVILLVALLCVLTVSYVRAQDEDYGMEDEGDNRAEAVKEFTAMFEKYDANKDDKLDSQELRTWIQEEEGDAEYGGGGHIEASIKELLEEADTNKDDAIDMPELLALSGFAQ